MLRIHNVKVPIDRSDYKKIVSQVLNIREKFIKDIELVKQSVDARREKAYFVCSFDFTVDNEEEMLKKYPQLSIVKPYHYEYPKSDDQHVVIIGSGPAGLFCGYVLSQIGQKVTLIERGAPIEERVKDVDDLMNKGILNPSSNIAFGEGGAGTFSDGKLTTGIKNKRLRYILETFVKHGAPKDILYLSKPHIGTDYLRKVIIDMRKEMIDKGVTFMFNTQMTSFEDHGDYKTVNVVTDSKEKQIKADALVLAIGHSARDTIEMLYNKGLTLQQKPFAIGVRIEQLQEKINEIQYKKSATSPYLKAASYKLAVQTKNKRGVYTFCMCPGGVVVPSMNHEGELCVNGMSYYARDAKNANSAILVNITTDDFESDHPLAGIKFQQNLEQKAYNMGEKPFYAPVQLVEDFFNNQKTVELKKVLPSYQPGYTLSNIQDIFPSFINESLIEGLKLMNQRMPGFIDEDTLITGIESRSSSPVRILRDETMQSSIKGIYPIGEGAGYAGGIMSAAVDGIMCAEMIVKGE